MWFLAPSSSGRRDDKAVSIYEISVSFYETAQRNIPEDSHLLLAGVRTRNITDKQFKPIGPIKMHSPPVSVVNTPAGVGDGTSGVLAIGSDVTDIFTIGTFELRKSNITVRISLVRMS
jgi:hypothetical protein